MHDLVSTGQGQIDLWLEILNPPPPNFCQKLIFDNALFCGHILG